MCGYKRTGCDETLKLYSNDIVLEWVVQDA